MVVEIKKHKTTCNIILHHEYAYIINTTTESRTKAFNSYQIVDHYLDYRFLYVC